jgi:hypothetical protein
MFVELLKNVEFNKYKLIQLVLREGAKLAKMNPDFDPFYTGNFIRKVEKSLLKEQEDQ